MCFMVVPGTSSRMQLVGSCHQYLVVRVPGLTHLMVVSAVELRDGSPKTFIP